MRRGPAGLALVAALVVTLLAAPAAPAAPVPAGGPGAGAGRWQPTGPTGTVRLVGQTFWLVAGQPFELRLHTAVSGPVDDLEVAVTFYRRLANRTEFVQTLEGRTRGAGIDQVRVPVADLVPDERGVAHLAVAPSLGREGVYPIRVELRERRGGPLLDSFTTHLVHLPQPVEGDRLKLAWVVPVHAAPSLRPDGTVEVPEADAESLALLAAALEAYGDVRLTLRPTPETLAALEASGRDTDRAVLASLARSRGNRQVVGGHFVATSLPGLLAAGLQGEAAAQLSEGIGTLTRLLGGPPDTRTWLSDERLDDTSLGQLARQQYNRLVVPESTLVPTDLPTTLTQTFELAAGEQRFRVAAADPGLADHMVGDADPTLAAYNLLADLSVVYFDRPARPGGVVLAPPRRWRPTAAFLGAFLAGLAASPVVVPATLDELFDAAMPAAQTPQLVRRMASPTADPPAVSAVAVRSVRRRLDAFGTVLHPDNPLYERIERVLLVSESVDLSTRVRNSYLAGARDEIDRQLGLIAIPADRSITLTAREGEIPVTITSRAAYPVKAVLHVESGTLTFPKGDRRPLELSRANTTERITVEARGSGSFPLRVRLESPDGSLVLAEGVFSVRSTAASGVGIALSVGAASFLLLWWGRHLHGRRSRRLVPA